MENTPYNQKIAEQLREINNRFLLNQDLTGKQVMEDDQIPLTKPNVSYGRGKSGGLIKTKVGGVKALGRAIGSGMAEMEGMGLMSEKKKRGRPRKGGSMGVDAMAQQKNLLTGGGPIGMFANMLGLGKEEEKVAGGFFDDIVSSVGNVVKTAADVAPQALQLAKLVRGKGKKQVVAKGGAKKSSWIAHVKSYAKKHNISYKDALKKAGASYK